MNHVKKTEWNYFAIFAIFLIAIYNQLEHSREHNILKHYSSHIKTVNGTKLNRPWTDSEIFNYNLLKADKQKLVKCNINECPHKIFTKGKLKEHYKYYHKNRINDSRLYFQFLSCCQDWTLDSKPNRKRKTNEEIAKIEAKKIRITNFWSSSEQVCF